MPVATIDTNAWERRELKSLEGAYIMVRPLPYGMKLERRDKATRMFMESEGGNQRGNRNNGAQTTNKVELEMLQKWSAMFDFRYCIGDHNLTDDKEVKLDLSNRLVFESLNPRVGSEIERILDEINNEDEDFDDEDFTKLPSSSLEAPTELLESTGPNLKS